MKKLFFAAIAATILFTSCEKGSIEPIVDDDTKAYLSVSVKSPESKSVGTEKPTDNVINNFTAFVAYSDGTLISKASDDGKNLSVNEGNAIEVSMNLAAGQDVYVVANAGNLTSIKTLDDLLKKIADLNKVNEGRQEAKKVWATGKTTSELVFKQEGDKFIAEADVKLIFIASRITVTIENGMNEYDAENTKGDLILEKVAVLNARGASHLFGQSKQSINESLIPKDDLLVTPEFTGTKFYSGIEGGKFINFPKDNVTPNIVFLADDIPANDFSKTYYYYVFENDANQVTKFPTIVTLVASHGTNKIYFPIHLASYEEFIKEEGYRTLDDKGLKRGMSYNITIRLKLDPSNPQGIDDPTKPHINAYVEVKLSIEDWEAVNLIKEF